MGYVRVELETGRAQYSFSENWYDSLVLSEFEDPRPHLDAVVAKVKAAYEAGS